VFYLFHIENLCHKTCLKILNILISDVRFKIFKTAVDRKCRLDRKKRGHKVEEDSSKYVLVSEGTVSFGRN
jgi:hypothetical protein